jgi:hypothetical protein
MLGRRAEQARATRAWDEARRGNPRLLLVHGPAGIGKTHLAATVARHAAVDGALVAYGRCDRDPLQPYEPFVKVLQDFDEQDHERTRLAATDRSPLVRLLPRLRVEGVDDVEPVDDPELETVRLFDAIADLFVELAQRRPLCVVIDDLEWADGSTVRLLRFLLTNLPSCRALFLATSRSPHEVAALADLLAALDRQGVVDHVSVPGLSVADTEELLVLAAPQLGSAIADTAPKLHLLTDGNPLYAREIATNLRPPFGPERGVDPIDALLAAGVPPSIDAPLRGRFDSLSVTAREVLEAGSVCGVEFTLDRATAVSDRTRTEVLDALDEAERSGSIAVDDAGVYRFTHRLFREIVYRAIPRLRRAQLHAAVAAEIESTAPDVDDRAMELAFHHCAALPVTDPATAVGWLRRSARRAQEQTAFPVAARELERAVDLLDRHGSTANDLCVTLVALGSALVAAGEPDRSRTVFQRAAALAIKHSLAEPLADAAIGGCGMWTGTAPAPDLMVHMEEAAAALEVMHAERGVDAELSRVLGRLAVLRFRATGDASAKALADRSMALSAAGELDRGRFEALHALHVTSQLHEPPSYRRDLARQMVAHAIAANHPANLVVARWEAIGNALESGGTNDLEDLMIEFEDLGAATRRPVDLWAADVVRACVATARGDLSGAEHFVHRSLHSGAGVDAGDVWDVHVLQLFLIRWYEGRATELAPIIEAAAEREPSRAPATVGLGLIALEQGRRDAAVRAVQQVLSGEVRFVRNEHWLGWMCALAYLVAQIGDRAAAEELRPQLEPFAASHALIGRTIVWLGSVGCFVGLLAGTIGDEESARNYLADALEQNRSASLGFWTTEAKSAAARLGRLVPEWAS